MSSERIQEPIENLEDYSSSPPFFGKDKWTIDPTKIVTRPPENSLPTIPEEEEEGVKETVKTSVKTQPKRVRFASYVEVYPANRNGIQYRSKSFAELQKDNAISLKERQIEELERKLKRARRELTRAYDCKLIIIMVSLGFVLLVMSYSYAKVDL